MKILLISLKVFRDLLNARMHDGDLNFRRAGIPGLSRVFCDDLCLLGLIEWHSLGESASVSFEAMGHLPLCASSLGGFRTTANVARWPQALRIPEYPFSVEVHAVLKMHVIACFFIEFASFESLSPQKDCDRMLFVPISAIIDFTESKSMRSHAKRDLKQASARFGAAIRQRRKELGLTQREAASLAGCDRLFVSQVEKGKPSIRLDKLLDLLSSLGFQLTLETGNDRLKVEEAND